MTSWHQGRLTAFDVESTGVDVEGDRIVTACVLRAGGGQEIEQRRWLIAVDIDIPQAATDVHGITTEQARAEGISARAALEGIVDELDAAFTLGCPVVAYNASFDFTMLDRECRRWLGEGLPFEPRPVVDPFVTDKALDRYRRGKRTLTATCEHYSCRLDEAHAAHGDALAAARLAWRLACVYPDDCADLEQLHDKQAAWAAEQATGLADYFRRLAAQQSDSAEREQLLVKADGVSGEWPLRPWRETEVAVA